MDKSRTKKLRIIYAILTVLLVGVEVIIALFVHDKFVRPYGGDILVVIVVYCFVRIFIPEKFPLMPLAVFIFACIVEGLQYIHIVDLLGLTDNRFLSTLVGTSASFEDILCYAAGCLPLGVYEFLRMKSLKR